MTIFHYGSDLHFEFGYFSPKFKFPEGGDYLILAGDTLPIILLKKSRNDADARSMKKYFVKFLKEASKYKKIIFIFGNHEFYRGAIDDTRRILEDFLYDNKVHNVIILDDEIFQADDVTVIGSTLWTDMGKNSPLSHYYVGQHMNDYKVITKTSDSLFLFNTQDAYDKHQISKEFIFTESKNYAKVLVVTHHAPSYQCNDNCRYPDIHMVDGYCSDLEWLMYERPNISHWICGHTHNNHDFKISETRVISNCRGYPSYTGYGTQGYDAFNFKELII